MFFEIVPGIYKSFSGEIEIILAFDPFLIKFFDIFYSLKNHLYFQRYSIKDFFEFLYQFLVIVLIKYYRHQ